jgi:hypothetical protein
MAGARGGRAARFEGLDWSLKGTAIVNRPPGNTAGRENSLDRIHHGRRQAAA